MKEWVQIINKLEEILNSNESFALATVIQVEGSTYRRVGARMLIMDNGNWIGSISGGCLEGDMLKKARLAMSSQEVKWVTYDTRDEDPFALGIGLGCNGKIDILIDPNRTRIENFAKQLKLALASENGLELFSQWPLTDGEVFELKEFINPQPRIWVFGNQFDSHSLILMAKQLGWKVMWVGNTLKMSNEIKKLCFKVFDWDNFEGIQSSDLLVQMTHDLERDVEICSKLNEIPDVFYWGILGPQKRLERIKDKLSESQIMLKNGIHSPIGLDLGAEGPDEIAVSIIAEIIAKKNKRDAQPLKLREKAIHEA